MELITPQEIQIQIILPAIRKELARVLVEEKNMKQKEVAQMLGVTESAISQYMRDKRGSNIVFEENVKKEISKTAARLKNKEKPILEEMLYLINLPDIFKWICSFHTKNDPNVKEKCKICFENNYFQEN